MLQVSDGILPNQFELENQPGKGGFIAGFKQIIGIQDKEEEIKEGFK